MGRAVVQVTLFGLLLALATTLPVKDDWNIYSFHINSTVSSRYAITVITSRVANRMHESKEIEFHVRIPKNAFISKFNMLIDGQVYDGVVKAKEQARKEYTHAVTRGQSAGLVSSVGRTLEEFKTSVTVAAHKKVTFELTYEELLQRKLGKYELQIYARPMQPVADFKVDVYIKEKARINFIEVKGGLNTKALANAVTKTHADKETWVHFYPTVDQQKSCDSCNTQGMNGDLVVVYDVHRDSNLGEIKTSEDGYFVHHFGPSSLSRISKNVVFVIDQSGSMHGRKIIQTRLALIHILNDLVKDDFFGIITFDSQIFEWKRELVQATEENVESAKTFARNIKDNGATDINRALLKGAKMLNAHPRQGSASILILLTDGDPTTGERNFEVIQSNVRKAIAGKFPLYCLGFGFDVNFEFLEKMSLQNNGVARRIYEDSDADLQLQDFYEEVAVPLLTDVTMTYIGGTNLTQTNFSQYYNGSEIVVAGRISENDIGSFIPKVVGISNSRMLVFSDPNAMESTGAESDSHIQRVWAYLTVKQLLEKRLLLSGSEEEDVTEKALRLSLKYNFVTPLTSMVVTKPQGETTDVLDKPKEGAAHSAWNPPLPPVVSSMMPILVYSKLGSPPGARFIPGVSGPPGSSGPRGGSIVLKDYVASYPDRMYDYGPVLHSLSGHHPGLSHGTDAPLIHRFLLKNGTQSLPLCFDVSGKLKLKLLHHPASELTVNGELNSVSNRGFKRIFIHLKTDIHIEVDTNGMTVQQGQTRERHNGEHHMTLDRLTLIRRDKEIDVMIGDIRLIIVIHGSRRKFLWPALRQSSSDTNVSGILAVEPAVYEAEEQNPITKLKINNQDIDVTRSSALDYSIAAKPRLSCWLMSAESALQRQLDDFIATQL